MSQQEAKRRIQKALMTGSTKLDLSNLNLISVPIEIEKLSQLKDLNLEQQST